MRTPVRLLAILAVLGAGTAHAQDQFGRAVGIAGDEVVILKPTTGRGLPTAFVYRQTQGAWSVMARLQPENAGSTGESFGTALAASGSTVLVASGDAALAAAAHRYRRSAGGWSPLDQVPVNPGAPTASTGGKLDLAGLMAILQPPQRVIAADRDGDRVLVAVRGGQTGQNGVRVLERSTDGAWIGTPLPMPPDAGANDQTGAALALRGDWAFVGAPGFRGGGAVLAYTRSPAGVWSIAEAITRRDGAEATRFGATLALDGDRLLVAATGGGSQRAVGAVFTFALVNGKWTERGRITSPSTTPDGFGSALAVSGDELWVGAPMADGRKGAVHRFTRSGRDAPWTSGGAPLVGPPVSTFGSAVALTDRIAVVGAPLADGADGMAALFARTSDGGWSEATWLQPAEHVAGVTGGEVRCDDGKAGAFSCDNVDLLAFLPLDALGGRPGERVSDIWGWTDPETKREYALVGRTLGAAFVDITDPTHPMYLGIVAANPSGARDLKVYRHHLFFTGDGAGDHGLQVFDLTRLRGLTGPPRTFTPDTVYNGIASAHNLVIDTDAGFAYPVGASGGGETCGGGLHMIDIREPKRPRFAGCYTDTEGLIWAGRTHDAQCVIYRGPDRRYAGRQICFASNETALRIVDVTDKASPKPLSAATYPGLSYVHQGWLTEDQRYFYLDDELDELVGQADHTRTMVWDVSELDDPVLVTQIFGPSHATDHNLYIKGNRMYQANYQAGLEVWDLTNPRAPTKVGRFDTTPYDGDPPGFNGAWTAYPFFDSGTVIVSSIREGLFVLRPRAKPLVP